MKRVVSVLYGVMVYLLFVATFLYLIAFVGNLAVPKTIDSGTAGSLVEAVVVNVLLLGLFAAQHSIMARPAFKRLWTRIVPKPIERSTYVLFASLALVLVVWQWRPISGEVWVADSEVWGTVITGVFWLGWAIVLISTLLIDHFELFGLAQVFAALRQQEFPAPVFRTPWLYKWVRHPLYVGFLLAFWSTPSMTWGHLLFSVGTTGYILLGAGLEERDLVTLFGEQYRRYRKRVRMLFPWPRRTTAE
ncbi:MAG: hypothetical protein ABS35_27340 [Kaistia sp. SCN 65-12]|nr:MAG: hypothetical protein ABS35_27340 [Kaistia sp. SCN 65-12]